MVKTNNNCVAVGYSFNLKNSRYEYKRNTRDYNKEVDLFLTAKDNCYKNLNLLYSKTTGELQKIIKAQMMFVADKYVSDEVVKRITTNKESAGYAYSIIVEKYINELQKTKVQYLQERANEFLDIKDNILKEIYQPEKAIIIDRPTILIVDYLYTSLVLNLPEKVKGIIAKTGGELSHAAILLKEKNIPYIIEKDFNSENAILLEIDSTNKTIKKLENSTTKENTGMDLIGNQFADFKGDFKLYLNVSSPEDINLQHLDFYEGVGLLRTEHLLIKDSNCLFVTKQVEVYKNILAMFFPKVVRIRLFDFKEDKGLPFLKTVNVNEFKFNGPIEPIYKEQLKAILTANESYGNCQIIIPLINDVLEYHQVENYLQELKKELKFKKAIPKVGIMLETKKAFLNMETFKNVKFISIGTNDLTQELFNINRQTSLIESNYTKQLIKAIKEIKQFAEKYKIDYSVCGEIASNVIGLKSLIEADFKSFSIAGGFLKSAVETFLKK